MKDENGQVIPRTVEALTDHAERMKAERDEARLSIGIARYCLDVDAGPTAVRACLDGMGLEDGIREEYQSDLDWTRARLDRAEAEVERLQERNHARFMAAGWRRRAKESRQNALTGARWVRELKAERDLLRTVVEAARAMVAQDYGIHPPMSVHLEQLTAAVTALDAGGA